jgi:hypothetical protein
MEKESQQTPKENISGIKDPEIDRKVKALSRKHGGGILRSETNGLHLYIPCPECLKTAGTRELHAKHLAVNIDKCFGLGKFSKYRRSRFAGKDGVRNQFVALCHKTNKSFTVEELLRMPDISERGIKAVQGEVVMAASNAVLLQDEKGRWIPYPPGDCIPLIELPPHHPAMEYVLSRGYDPKVLHEQMGAAFCYRETPPDNYNTKEEDKIGVYYRNMPDGWKDTPQGRLILYANIRGAKKGWQARILEKKEDGWKWYFHPYRKEWVAVEKQLADGSWQIRNDYAEEKYQWKPSKYRMATGTDASKGVGRSSVLLGFDAALAWNEKHNTKIPFVVLCEGPLDAGRIGPPAVAMLGKYLSDPQVNLIKSFKKVIVVLDNDDAGAEGLIRVKDVFKTNHIRFDICTVPKQFKDVGEMSTSEAWDMLHPVIKDCL